VLTPFEIMPPVLKALHNSYEFLIRSAVIHLGRSELVALEGYRSIFGLLPILHWPFNRL
jgi:hypothetical protein